MTTRQSSSPGAEVRLDGGSKHSTAQPECKEQLDEQEGEEEEEEEEERQEPDLPDVTVSQELTNGGIMTRGAISAMRSALSGSATQHGKAAEGLGAQQQHTDSTDPALASPFMGHWIPISKSSSKRRTQGLASASHCISSSGRRCGPDCQGACTMCVRAGATADLSTLLVATEERHLLAEVRTSQVARRQWAVSARTHDTVGLATASSKDQPRHTGPLFRRVHSTQHPHGAATCFVAPAITSKAAMITLKPLITPMNFPDSPAEEPARAVVPLPAASTPVFACSSSARLAASAGGVPQTRGRAVVPAGSRSAGALWCCTASVQDEFDELQTLREPRPSFFTTQSGHLGPCKVVPWSPGHNPVFGQHRAPLGSVVLQAHPQTGSSDRTEVGANSVPPGERHGPLDHRR